MKKVGKLLTGAALVFAAASTAIAGDCAYVEKVQSYAHPTMFGSQSQQTSTATSSYVVGGTIVKSANRIGVAKKDHVLVQSWANDVLSLMKTNKGDQGFNVKMPVLRSELAFILAEGFGIKSETSKKAYKDITSDYWAKDWIYGALNEGIMIGYPDGNFRPDQPVTKAELFATIAQIINVPIDKSLIVPPFQGKEIKHIPAWAITPTKEVVASKILEYVPNPEKVNNDEYLSREQVANLVGAIRQDWASGNTLGKDPNASAAIQNYTPTALTIKLTERISARHSNVGDKFTAKTTKEVTVNGKTFKAGSAVKGEVIEVSRPGVDNPGYIKVKFNKIQDGDVCACFPKNISQAQAETLKNPNILARLVGFPLSGAGRVVGVVGRSGAAAVNVAGNGLEQLGDNLSNMMVDTFSLQPVAGLKNFGNSFVTVGKGVYDITKLAVSGTFGVLYEVTDEVRYLIVPSYSNASSLNPGEELTIVF